MTTINKENIKTYKGIKYYLNWNNGNWFLMLPEYQNSIQLVDNCSSDDIKKILDREVYQFL